MYYSVLVSSSILNLWQERSSANNYPGDDLHIDYITILGACIKDLHHAFITEFKGVYKPVLLLVRGVNDVLQGQTVEQILQDILNFKQTVLSMCVNPSAGEISSVAVATVPFSPMATAVPGEPRSVDAEKL